MEQTRIRECRRERRYWKEKGKMSVVVWVLLRLRGFLHAFHLVEMTIPTPPKKNVISSKVERSPSVRYEQRCLPRRFFGHCMPSE